MALTKAQKQTIGARSRALREWLLHDFPPPSSPADSLNTIARQARWCQAATKGDVVLFEKLLISRNIEPKNLAQLLSGSLGWDDRTLPDWCEILDEVIEEASRKQDTTLTEPLGTSGIRFEQFYAPFYAVARRHLEEGMPASAFNLSTTAQSALKDSLIRALHFVFMSALNVEFRVYQVRHGNARSPSSGTSLINEFVAHFWQPDCLASFLLEYSVAARAATTLMKRWHVNTAEFIERLSTDVSKIQNCFLAGASLGDVVQIDCSLSDPHNNGRSVMRVHFASDLRLIYKPRSVALDMAYNALLDWLDHHGAPHSLQKPVYLALEDYAWIEQIDHIPCASKEELLQFCRCAGTLLCVAYLLDATDLHDSNLIARTTSPILVDLETLLQPHLAEIQSSVKQDALRKAIMVADRSIFRTGLLPALKPGADGSVADVGCFGGLFEARSTDWYQHDRTASPLSEAMRQDIAKGALDSMSLAGMVAQGFSQTYRFLLEKRPQLLEDTGPLKLFNAKPVRFVLRETELYVKLLKLSLSAQALREGVDRSISLETLYRIAQTRPTSKGLGSLIEDEILALEALDVPLLLTSTDSAARQMSNGEQQGPEIFEQPSYDAMLERLHGFSESDLSKQLELLYSAFAARVASAAQDLAEKPTISTFVPASAPKMLVDKSIELGSASVIARTIFSELKNRSIIGEDGSATWLAPISIAQTRFFTLGIMPLDFHSGIMGIAFFLAAYTQITGDKDAGTLARQTVKTVLQRLGLDITNHKADNFTASIAGLGSMLYALQRIATFLNDKNIEAAAHRLSQGFAYVQGTGSNLIGNFNDCSELCLGLMALDQTEKASQLGQQLSEQWRGLDEAEKLATILASPHLALCWLRLYRRTGETYFCGASREILLLMCKAAAQDNAQLASFHFSLLECHDFLSKLDLNISLENHFAELRQAPALHADNLQEGNLSVAERLLVASQRLSQPELCGAAQKIIFNTLTLAREDGGFRTVSGMPRGSFFPSFYQGVSGIGYTLLRHQVTIALPCVQLWE